LKLGRKVLEVKGRLKMMDYVKYRVAFVGVVVGRQALGQFGYRYMYRDKIVNYDDNVKILYIAVKIPCYLLASAPPVLSKSG
jgi:hypothetical protein